MKWVAIIFFIVFALGFLFVAMAAVAALFASAGYDVMEDEQNKKRQESTSITTNRRLTGSGPIKDAKTPGVDETVSSVTLARPSKAAISPPLLIRTATITVTMPNNIMIPCIKSFMAVAIYPPAIT